VVRSFCAAASISTALAFIPPNPIATAFFIVIARLRLSD
jgi:hypothetical protein